MNKLLIIAATLLMVVSCEKERIPKKDILGDWEERYEGIYDADARWCFYKDGTCTVQSIAWEQAPRTFSYSLKGNVITVFFTESGSRYRIISLNQDKMVWEDVEPTTDLHFTKYFYRDLKYF